MDAPKNLSALGAPRRLLGVLGGTLPAAILVLVAIWSLASQRAELSRAPTRAEWALAQAVVREGFRQGDIIRTAPHWADGGRARMYEYPFNVAMAIEDEELYLYDRLWLLADAEHVEAAVAALPDGYTVVERWEPSHRTAVVLVDIPPADRVLFDAVTDLPNAHVTRVRGDVQEPCTIEHEGGWHCDHIDPWIHVTPSMEETGNSLHRCVYVGLPDTGVMRVSWPDVTLGRRLEGNVGNTMPAIRADRGGDITLRIEIDGRTVHEQTFGKWEQAFFPFAVDTSDQAAGAHELSFVLSTPDFYDRWICFRARALR